ncbi:MAG: PEP-CTERM sorting domain-containing protein [Bryobacteraceae bacterium]
MRFLVVLLASAATLWPSLIAYDCRLYDCVTPFQHASVPLPPGSSIPQPGPPGPTSLTFLPTRATVTGYVYGRTADGGLFLSDGTKTAYVSTWPDFHFIDLSDTGMIFFCEICNAPRITDFGLNSGGPSQPLGNAFSGGFEFRLTAFGDALAMNSAGTAFLLSGVGRYVPAGPLLESGLTMIFADPSFTPTQIPEPATIALAAAGILALARRRIA